MAKNRKKQHPWQRTILGWIFVLIFIVGGIILWQQFFRAHCKWVPAFGGIFTEATIGTHRNFNPLAPDLTSFDRDVMQLIYGGLLRHNPLTGQIEANLGSFRVSEDGKTYTITLNGNAKFSNGTPVTIGDVLFTFETVIQNPSFPNEVLRSAFEYISIDVVDEQTLAFLLPEPNVYFPALLTTPILHATSFQNALIEEIVDPSYPGNRHPIGTGPFQLKNIVPEDDGSVRFFLSRNPHYLRGKPYLRQIVFYLFPNYQHLKILAPWTTMYSKISRRNLTEFEKKLFGEYTRREYVLPRFVAIFSNLDSPRINNTALRTALSWSIDKNKILKNEPGWKRVDSPFFFEGVEDWSEPSYPAARQYLRDHGFKFDVERETFLWNKKPVHLRMITSVAPPVYSRLAQNIILTWKKELKISVDLDVFTPAKFQKALAERDYDLVLFGQNYSENFDTLSTWHSSQSGKLNLSNLTNDEVDRLIDGVRLSGSQSDLFELNQELGTIVPAVVLATPTYYLLVNHDLLGFSQTFGKIRKHAERFSNVHKWHFFLRRAWDWPSNKNKIFGFFDWIFQDEKN